jgi:hypothetical protein
MIRCVVAQKPEPCNVFKPPGQASFKFESKTIRAETRRLIGGAGLIGSLSKLPI